MGKLIQKMLATVEYYKAVKINGLQLKKQKIGPSTIIWNNLTLKNKLKKNKFYYFNNVLLILVIQ